MHCFQNAYKKAFFKYNAFRHLLGLPVNSRHKNSKNDSVTKKKRVTDLSKRLKTSSAVGSFIKKKIWHHYLVKPILRFSKHDAVIHSIV